MKKIIALLMALLLAALPAGAEISPVTLEELFVFMVKEGEA